MIPTMFFRGRGYEELATVCVSLTAGLFFPNIARNQPASSRGASASISHTHAHTHVSISITILSSSRNARYFPGHMDKEVGTAVLRKREDGTLRVAWGGLSVLIYYELFLVPIFPGSCPIVLRGNLSCQGERERARHLKRPVTDSIDQRTYCQLTRYLPTSI